MKTALKSFLVILSVAFAIALCYQYFITVIMGSYWNHASLIGIVFISIAPLIIVVLAALAVRAIIKS